MDRKVTIAFMLLLFLCFVPETKSWSGNVCTRLAIRWENKPYCVSSWLWGCQWRDRWLPIYYNQSYCCSGWSHNGTVDCTIRETNAKEIRSLNLDKQLNKRQRVQKSEESDDKKHVCYRRVVRLENRPYCKQRHWWRNCSHWENRTVQVYDIEERCCRGWSRNGTENCTIRESPDSEIRNLGLNRQMNERQRFPKSSRMMTNGSTW